MHADSRPVASPQIAPHHQLALLLARNAVHIFRKSPAAYGVAAFEVFRATCERTRAPVLDAGCGTGESTLSPVVATGRPSSLTRVAPISPVEQ